MAYDTSLREAKDLPEDMIEQAIVEKSIIITKDGTIPQYGVKVLW